MGWGIDMTNPAPCCGDVEENGFGTNVYMVLRIFLRVIVQSLCFNPLEAKRQKAHREDLLKELEAELASLSDVAKEGHTKQVCALTSSQRYGRLLKQTAQGLEIDTQAVKELKRFDGKFVVHSNDDTLNLSV